MFVAEVKAYQPIYICDGVGLSQVKTPNSVPPPNADPATVGPEYFNGRAGSMRWRDLPSGPTAIATPAVSPPPGTPNTVILGTPDRNLDMDCNGVNEEDGGPTFAAVTSGVTIGRRADRAGGRFGAVRIGLDRRQSVAGIGHGGRHRQLAGQFVLSRRRWRRRVRLAWRLAGGESPFSRRFYWQRRRRRYTQGQSFAPCLLVAESCPWALDDLCRVANSDLRIVGGCRDAHTGPTPAASTRSRASGRVRQRPGQTSQGQWQGNHTALREAEPGRSAIRDRSAEAGAEECASRPRAQRGEPAAPNETNGPPRNTGWAEAVAGPSAGRIPVDRAGRQAAAAASAEPT